MLSIVILLFRFISLTLFMYVLDYVASFFKRTRLIVRDGQFRQLLLSSDSIVNGYKPSVLFHRATLNTLANFFIFKAYPVSYENELLTLRDGGKIMLSWCGCKDDSSFIVAIIPGVGCHSRTNYITNYVRMLESLGYLVVVVNYRGMGTVLTTLRISNGCDFSDLEEALLHIAAKYPSRKLICFAMSLGGMILTRFLSDSSKASIVHGAFILSVPFDSIETSTEIEKFPNNILFNRLLTKTYTKWFRKNAQIFFKTEYDVQSVLDAKKLRDIDTCLISKLSGFKSCEDYYRECSVAPKVVGIDVPCLYVNAADDMFSPLKSIPISTFEKKENLALLLTPRGGHLAFLQSLSFEKNYVPIILRDYLKLLESMQ